MPRLALSLKLTELETLVVPAAFIDNPLIEQVGPGLGTVSLVALGSPTPNNDNGNSKVNFASFDLNYASRNYIDRVFEVNNSQGVTEYWIEDNVRNSGPEWSGFMFELGFGTGENFRRRGSPALDMDWPNQDPMPKNHTAMPFRDLSHGRFSIRWLEGLVLTNSNVIFFYTIDVCDYDALNMPSEAATPNGYRFTLRAYPLPIAVHERPDQIVGKFAVDSTQVDRSNDFALDNPLGLTLTSIGYEEATDSRKRLNPSNQYLSELQRMAELFLLIQEKAVHEWQLTIVPSAHTRAQPGVLDSAEESPIGTFAR